MTTTAIRDYLGVSFPLLGLSLAFLLVAVAMPGANAADTIWAFAVGTVVVGAVMGIMFTAIGLLGRRSHRRLGSGMDVLGHRPRWRWLVHGVVAISLVGAALGGDPEDAAYIAGFPVGAMLGALPLILLPRH
jgi:hypothetical protein